MGRACGNHAPWAGRGCEGGPAWKRTPGLRNPGGRKATQCSGCGGQERPWAPSLILPLTPQISHTFTDYGPGVRFVRFEHGGQDSVYWKGWFGARVTNSSVWVEP